MECNSMKDLDEILGMAKNVQAELEKAQANLDQMEVEGVPGGGLVKVRATAKGRIVAVDIDQSLLAPSEKQMLEELVAAALTDARTKEDQVRQKELSKRTDGLNLPQTERAWGMVSMVKTGTNQEANVSTKNNQK